MSVKEEKIELQQLVKRYKQMQAAAKAGKKVNADHLDKLRLQIRAKQNLITSLSNQKNVPLEQEEIDPAKLMSRVQELENAHQGTREQLNELLQAKQEIERLREQVDHGLKKQETQKEDHVQEVQDLRRKIDKLQVKIDQEEKRFQREMKKIRQQADHDVNLLIAQRDNARNTQKKLEIEKVQVQNEAQKNKYIWIGVGTGVGLVAGAGLLIGALTFTPLLDGLVASKSINTASQQIGS